MGMNKGEWINLVTALNCFGDGKRAHLACKVDGVWYAISHTKNPRSVSIPNELIMNVTSTTGKHFLSIANPNTNNPLPSHAKIHRSVIEQAIEKDIEVTRRKICNIAASYIPNVFIIPKLNIPFI